MLQVQPILPPLSHRGEAGLGRQRVQLIHKRSTYSAVAPLTIVPPHFPHGTGYGTGLYLPRMARIPELDRFKRCFCFDHWICFASYAVTPNNRIIKMHIKPSNFWLFAAERAVFCFGNRLELVHHTRPVFSGLEMNASWSPSQAIAS